MRLPTLRLSLESLLAVIPFALALWWFEASPLLVFTAAAFTIIPLSKVLGSSTEALARFLGPTLGGLLNASMGNAPELIIGVFALRNGLVDVVKASITGSIIGNILLTLGLAMLTGGIKYPVQRFNMAGVRLAMTLMMLAVVGMMVPALFRFASPETEHEISRKIAAILLTVYGLSLLFTLRTHRRRFETPAPEELTITNPGSWKHALAVLAASSVALSFMSEILTDSLEPATQMLGFNPVFSGIILLASLGNVSSIMNAVVFARKDQMDLVVSSVIGAATQVALLVAPVLIFASLLFEKPLDLQFTRLEIVAVAISVLVANNMTLDGECDWLEGAMLLAVFSMLGIGFFFLHHPA